MARVFVHTRPHRGAAWQPKAHDFTQVPCVGEYIVIQDDEERLNWFLVGLVVHVGFAHRDFDAEIYAESVDERDALELAFPQA